MHGQQNIKIKKQFGKVPSEVVVVVDYY